MIFFMRVNSCITVITNDNMLLLNLVSGTGTHETEPELELTLAPSKKYFILRII